MALPEKLPVLPVVKLEHRLKWCDHLDCFGPASPDPAPATHCLLGPFALATRTEFGLGNSAVRMHSGGPQGVWFKLKLCLGSGSCHQSLEFRIITASLDSPWTYRKSRFETRAISQGTYNGSSLPPFPLPFSIWPVRSPSCMVIGRFVSLHPVCKLSLWKCGFPKTFQLFQGVRWNSHKNLSRAGFGVECSRLTHWGEQESYARFQVIIPLRTAHRSRSKNIAVDDRKGPDCLAKCSDLTKGT